MYLAECNGSSLYGGVFFTAVQIQLSRTETYLCFQQSLGFNSTGKEPLECGSELVAYWGSDLQKT